VLPKLLLLPCLTALALTTPGCLMTITEPALRVDYVEPVAVRYRPLLYDGFTVYYADDGIPYYLRGGARHWVPVHARARYISHWRSYKPAYRDWYRQQRPDRPQQWRGDDRRNDRPRDNNRRDDRPRRDDNMPWYRDRNRRGDTRPADDTQSPVAEISQPAQDQTPRPWYHDRKRRDDNRPAAPDQQRRSPITPEPDALPPEQVAGAHSRMRPQFPAQPYQRDESELPSPLVRTDRRGEPELNEAAEQQRQENQQRIAQRRQRTESTPPSLGVRTDRRGEPELDEAAKRQRELQEQQQRQRSEAQMAQRQRTESAPPSLGVRTDRRGAPESAATPAKRGDTLDDDETPPE
jgi:hypothetical protein